MKKHTSKAKILIVDDRIENLIALEKILKRLDLDIHKATSGNEALKLVLQHDFAVTLIDVMMPGMDGFEVAELMHSNEITMHTPIIFVTAMNKNEVYVIKGMEVGAVDYLYKPIDPTILLSKVRVFVDLFEVKEKLQKTIEQLHESRLLLEKRNAELLQLSNEDVLTKLSNRRYFEKEFEKLLHQAERYHRVAALFFLDLDNFKGINDQFGHDAGDLLLKTIGNRLTKAFRSEEILARSTDLKMSSTIGRLGGDEFVIAVGDVGNKHNAAAIAKRILNVIAQPVTYQDKKFAASASIGIACFPTAGTNIKNLMRAADTALYKAKEVGKNTFQLFE